MPIAGSRAPIIERIKSKTVMDISTGCHIFTGARATRAGYGIISSEESGKRPAYVHRAVWESVNGPMPTTPCPDGSHRWELHHACGQKLCCRAECIRLVTHREHMRIHRHLRAARKVALKEAA